MEKKTLIKLACAALVVGSLASCNEELELIAENSKDAEAREFVEQKLSEYTANFVDRYGAIDPEQDWGFGPIVDNHTRGEVINKNEWISIYHLQVPGWPDTYYCQNDETVHDNGYHYLDDSYNATLDDSKEPGGDVTDEEIQYVSWWFRTHRYPTSLQVHWSDFYIQEVSSDNDRKADGTVDKDFVVFEYREAEQSWEKSIKTYDMTMDYLGVKTQDDPTTFHHLEKFNGARQNKLHSVDDLPMFNESPYLTDCTVAGVSTPMGDITNTRLIDFYTCMSTEDFMCHNSVDNTDRSNYRFQNAAEPTPVWVLVHLHFIGPSGRIYDGYYLAFDFASFKNNGTTYEMREPDGYYSNWIVKISPAIPIVENNSYTRRIMCEDLGNTFDLDFDDIVFDVTLNQSTNTFNETGKADITVNLMAAGGTMPVWVGKNPGNSLDAPFEAHRMFNHETSQPVNVEAGYNAPIANYHVELTGTAGSAIDFDDLGIYIYNDRESKWIEIPKVKYLNQLANQGAYKGTTDPVYAPQKFAVPASVLWLKETKQIETAYQYFGKWASNHSQYSIDTEDAWYAAKNLKTVGNLCGQAGATPYNNSATPGQLADNGLPGTTATCWCTDSWDVVPYVNNAAWGSVSLSGNNVSGIGKRFTAGETCTLTATPASSDCHFLGWKNGESSDFIVTGGNYTVNTDGSLTVKVTRRENIVAVFSGPKATSLYQVTMVATGVDGVSISNRNYSDGQCGYDEANNKYYRARLTFSYNSVNDGNAFIDWYVNGVKQNRQTENTCEFFIEGPTVVEARAGKSYQLPVKINVVDAQDNAINEPWNSDNFITLNNSNNYGNWEEGMNVTYATCVGAEVLCRVTAADGYDVIWADGVEHPVESTFTVFEGMFLEVTFKKRAE